MSVNIKVQMKRFLGGFLIVAGIFIALNGVIACIDPMGTKVADDSDPFGAPTSRYESSAAVLFGLGICGAGRWLWTRPN
jgi:hypothetical protein